MSSVPERAVFDCNVFFQALASPHGPAARLLDFATRGRLALYASSYTLRELSDVACRRHIVKKYRLDPAVVAKFISDVERVASIVDAVPHVFDFPRDPDDAHYVDLAVAVDAKLIVSRDKDLLSLRDISTVEGREFCSSRAGSRRRF
jgi:putative PIN family toxin of toxin-antitoxin system